MNVSKKNDLCLFTGLSNKKFGYRIDRTDHGTGQVLVGYPKTIFTLYGHDDLQGIHRIESECVLSSK